MTCRFLWHCYSFKGIQMRLMNTCNNDMIQFTVTAIFAGLLLCPLQSFAKTQDLGKHGVWHAYKNGNVCYMASPAKSSKGNYTKRGNVVAVVTHRKGQSRDVMSLHAGYSFSKGATVKATVKAKAGNKSETMFTDGEIAWFADAKTDSSMVAYMTKKGTELEVKGKSSRGTDTTDTYSLRGMYAAYKTICKACDYKVDAG